ncbi:MAG TPA: hypothetical protein VNZ52_08265 [Candidatus Thermoplasmatota archaeon]|nr:hypothetical protein [Candidatus Thermoplasmatota archaeon]
MRENHVRRRRHEPESDATDVVAWCENCGAETRFLEERVQAPYETEGVEEPLDVRGIVVGNEVWRCRDCGTIREDPIADEAYVWEHGNDGYRVRAFPDEEVTWRAAGDEVRTK